MTQLFEIQTIEGKGVGFVATKEIKRGTVIFTESPQLDLALEEKGKIYDVEFNPILLEKVMSSFNRMKKTDQEDYLKLHNNFDHIHSLPPQKYSLLKTELEMRRLSLNSIEANKEKAEEMIKIFNIYGSNAFLNGVYLKMSRLNHSCRPNAEICSDSDVSKPLNIRAMSKIETGEEIFISYKFALVSMNRKERREFLIDRKHFVCHCRFCFEDAEDENDLKFYGMFRELENLKIDRGVGSATFEADDSYQAYIDCRKGVDLCKELYKLGKEKNLSPQVLFDILVDGFNFATIGFFPNCEHEAKERFRNDCGTFVKAAGKFRKILANSILVDPEVGRMQQILRNDYYKREMAEVFRDDRPGGPESTPPGWNRVTDMSQLDFPKLSVEDIATLMKRK